MSNAKTQTDTWFSIDAGLLAKELTVLETACERKETIPILSTVLLETVGQRLHLTTTDLDVSLEASCAVEVGRDYATAVRARQLTGIVTKGSGPLTFRLDGERLTVKDLTAEINLPASDKSHYPSVQKIEEGLISLPAKPLRSMIHKTALAIDKVESKWSLSAVLLRSKEGKMEMTANNQHRISVASAELDGESFEMTIPKKALQILYSLLDQVESVTVNQTNNLLRFDLGERILTARKLATSFPRIDNFLAQVKTTAEVTLETAIVRRALERLEVLLDDRTEHIRLEIGSSLTIGCASADRGEGKITVPVGYDGKPLVIGINYRYLLDALKVIDTPNFSLAFDKPESPVVLTSGGYRSIIQPIRANMI